MRNIVSYNMQKIFQGLVCFSLIALVTEHQKIFKPPWATLTSRMFMIQRKKPRRIIIDNILKGVIGSHGLYSTGFALTSKTSKIMFFKKRMTLALRSVRVCIRLDKKHFVTHVVPPITFKP